MPDSAALAHVDVLGEELVLLRVDDGEGMDGDQDFVTIAVDPHGVVVVLVVVYGRRELDVDFLSHSGCDHSLLIIPDFEVICLWRQNMEPLRLWRVVDDPQLHRVGLVCLETSELDGTRGGSEDAIGTHGVIDMLVGNGVALVGFSFCDYSSL